MPRFFVAADDVENSAIRIVGADAQHIARVLRMKPGERLTACDERGVEYETEIVRVGAEVELRILSSKPSENEPPYEAVVYQALAKGDRFDTVLMKATELGASAIVPVVSARCTVRLTEAEIPRKLERWRRIVAEAAKQSGRGRIPEVRQPMALGDAVRQAAGADLALFCYEEERETTLADLFGERETIHTASVLIGPEGGFEPSEAAEAASAGMRATGLGRRILRTETAAPFVLACLSCQYELGTAVPRILKGECSDSGRSGM